jgi:MFS transporter, DHA3 family, tetracycline resistance protein
MSFDRRGLSARQIYLIFSGASALFFSLIVTVNLVYQVEIARLNPLQLVLVGTALEVTCFFCQVPTGILADMYSRRLAVIIGAAILGIGFIFEGSIPHFVAILLGQALFGVGATFMDGAEQAWVTDEVGEEQVGSLFVRSTQIGLIGGLIGALLSVTLASIRVNIPVVVGGLSYILLAVFLFFFMPENGFRPTPREERQSWREIGITFLSGVRIMRRSSILLIIMLIALFYGLSSEGIDRLSAAHFLTNFTFPSLGQLKPVVWFGLFSLIGTPLTLGVSELIRRYVDMNSQKLLVWLLFMSNVCAIFSVLLFALTGNFFLAVAGYLLYGVFRRINQPIYTTWLIRNIDAKARATLISFNGQMDALGQIAGGPPVGFIGSVFSLRAALVAVSIILSPILLLLLLAAGKLRRQREEIDSHE